jgi:hypothetical protein
MKVFTKLIKVVMVFLLMTVVVIVQAQSGKKLTNDLSSDRQTVTQLQNQGTVVQNQGTVQKKVISGGQNGELVPLKGASEDFAIPGNNPFESQVQQKEISGTDDMTVLVLDHNGFISTGRRAPSNGSNYQRAIYLLTPTDMTSSGMTSGMMLNAIGWQIYNGIVGVGTLTGTLNIYIMNTNDATFTLGTTWNVGSFTQVYNNASYTIPIAAGWFDVPFTSNFSYTGGGIYVAWEFSATGTPGTTVVAHFVNTTLTGGIINAYSNTAMPTTLTSAASRPMTRLGLSGTTDIVGVTGIYTLEKAPIPYGAPVALGAGLQNISASPVTTNVTIEVRRVSDNTLLFTNTQPLTIPAASYGKVTFTSWTPTVAENVKYIVFSAAVPGDTWAFNNTKTILGTVNNNLYSYFYTPTVATNYGFGLGTGIFSAKYTMTGSGLVTGANIGIGNYSTNTGNTIQAVMLNSAGTIVATAPAYVLLAGDLGTVKSFTFTTPVVVANNYFYVGLLQVAAATAWYPMGCANEVPQRGGTFYTFSSTGGTPLEFTLDYKYLLEAQVTQSYANDMAIGEITSPVAGSVGVQNVTVTVVNSGTASQSNIPVYYTYNAVNYNGTVVGPVAGGASVSYTFPQTINPPLGANTITVCTNLAGDQNTANDCMTKNFNITPAFNCQWTIDLYDDYGDGWNGGQMDVIVDGYTLLDNITLASGFGPATFTFGTNTGSAIQTVFVVNGSYPEECSYEVYDNFGGFVASSGPTLVTGTPPPNLNLAGSCECTVPCPPSSLLENEPDIPDEGVDITNLGCNALDLEPPGVPVFTPIALGDTYCGKSNTYVVGTTQRRDTDWYRIDLTSPSTYWHLNFTVTAEFPLQILILSAGVPEDCTSDAVIGSAVVGGCEVATIDGDFPSGVYYFWVGPSVYTGYPASTGPHDYVATLTGSQIGYPVAVINPLSVEKSIGLEETSTGSMSIGNTGAYLLDYSASTPGVNNTIIGENFDSYTAGGQLACQSPNWTTWSQAPCDPVEDGYISNLYAHSAPNSVVIVQNNDQIKLLGDITTGKYNMSFWMYIPAGKSGYFNTLSEFTLPYVSGGYWAFECYFNVGGIGALTANHSAHAFTWVEDVWQKVEVIVDLDNDVAEFWIGGNFVYSWPWSQGSSTGTGPLKLDANDFFGAAATDEMYMDDYSLNEVLLGWLTLDGGTAVSGTINPGDPAANIVLGFSSVGKPAGTYTTNIYLSTNELGAKTSYVIPVTMRAGYAVTGTVYYGTTNTKPMWNNITVTLTPVTPPGPPITVSPASGGGFDIRPLGNGTYTLTGATTRPWTSDQLTFDATLVLRYAALVPGYDLTNLKKRAADVNQENVANGVNTFDATLMLRRAAVVPTPTWTAPPFVFDGPYPSTPIYLGLPVTISGGNVVQDLRTLCSGDVNGSVPIVGK